MCHRPAMRCQPGAVRCACCLLLCCCAALRQSDIAALPRRYELGRQAAMTKLSSNVCVRRVRVRGGNSKFRALRLDHGNFSWGSEVRGKHDGVGCAAGQGWHRLLGRAGRAGGLLGPGQGGCLGRAAGQKSGRL